MKQMKQTKSKKVGVRIASNKAKILSVWNESDGNVSKVCKLVNIGRKTFYRWIEQDEDFAKAIIEKEGLLHDEVKERLIQEIRKNNMTAIIFYLRRRHPDFLDRPSNLAQMNVEGNVKVKIIDYSKVE